MTITIETIRKYLTMEYADVIKLGTYDKEGDFTLIKRKKNAKILGVCHADFVAINAPHKFYYENGIKTAENLLIKSPRLDDRLGLFLLVEVLKDFSMDILICNDEERGASTAANFKTEKKYNWVVELDRHGDDVVLYDYHTKELEKSLTAVGFTIGRGSFSDICALDLGRAAFNVGIGYHREHTADCFCNFSETIQQINKFKAFYDMFKDTVMPSTFKPRPKVSYTAWQPRQGHYRGAYSYGAEEDYYGEWWEAKQTKHSLYKWDYTRACYVGKDGKDYKMVRHDTVLNGVTTVEWVYEPIKKQKDKIIGDVVIPVDEDDIVKCPLCKATLDIEGSCPRCGAIFEAECETCGTNPTTVDEVKHMHTTGLCFFCTRLAYI